MYYIEKEFWICCSHRLNNDNLSIEENKKIFGKCNNFPGHGHNYKVILKLEVNDIEKNTGMIMNFYDIKEIFKKYIDDIFDHQHLNNLKHFEGIIPSAENMCKVFFDILKPHLKHLSEIKIYEIEGACAGYVG